MENITKEIKVKINPNSKQRVLFKRNFGSCRKVYNEVLGRYNSLYETDNSITPTWELLNKIFDETKQELHYLDEVESTSLQESIVDLHSDFNDYFTNESNNYPKFHTKKKTQWSFRQIPDNKSVIEGDKLFLREYGAVKFQASGEVCDLLNNIDTELNDITITFDNQDYYAIINIVVAWDNV